MTDPNEPIQAPMPNPDPNNPQTGPDVVPQPGPDVPEPGVIPGSDVPVETTQPTDWAKVPAEQNPALRHDVETGPRSKQYIVVGTQSVFEHIPGEVFTATLTKEQEENFIKYGQLAYAQQESQQPEGTQAPVVQGQPQPQPPTEGQV